MKYFLYTLITFLTTFSAYSQTTSITPDQNISTDSNVVYRLFSTKNMYNFIKLDTRNGLMEQVQWSTEAGYRGTWWLNKEKFAKPAAEIMENIKEDYHDDYEYWEELEEDWQTLQADSTISDADLKMPHSRDLIKDFTEETIKNAKPSPFEEYVKYWLDRSEIEQNGRFFLYPTTNIYNFILLDQIDGRTWQVQWSVEEKDRMIVPIY